MRIRSLMAGVGTGSVLALSQTAAGAAPAAQPTPPARPSALVAYSDRMQGGQSQPFGTGVYDTSSGGLGAVGNDQITSLRVAPGYQVVACEDGGGEGSGPTGSLGLCRYFGAGRHDHVGDDLSDRISLLAVVARPAGTGGATAYQDEGLTGARLKLGTGGYEQVDGDLDRLAGTVRSLKVNAGHRAVVCDNDRANGMDLGTCRLFLPGAHRGLGADLGGRVSLIALAGAAQHPPVA
ncbi:hypothetical protein CS0771_65730 [Catellatospora sp. IY07-71]|uniref:hypothetical protein n=1 Tax=Catellatospora sp. IY07-71 TaxID=2728827 RepID=UPI001BB378CC|nr:hypothetical protein [Catellatospora sp. IY07-71]BCJ77029.1 hypothetical protein CS0771_65730 [Catellatospora sp. IY07-71]